MGALALVLVIVALVLFILAAMGINASRVNLTAAGLACLAGAQLAGRMWPG